MGGSASGGGSSRSVSPAASTIGEDVRPFYAEHQKVTLKILPREGRIEGLAAISIHINNGNLKTISLNARHLNLKQIVCEGETCSFEWLNWEGNLTKGLPANSNPLQFPERLKKRVSEELKHTELEISLPKKPISGSTLNLSLQYEIPYDNHNPGIMWRQVEGENGILKDFQCAVRSIVGMGRVWTPCLEGEEVSWDLEYHIIMTGIPESLRGKLTVASSGALCQQFTNDLDTRIFQYRLDSPTIPSSIAFVAGLFETTRIPGFPFASALGPINMATKLRIAVDFLTKSFGFVNWYLGGVSFPYPSYQLIFIRDLLTIEEHHSAANLSLISSLHLIDEGIIDQVFDTRLRLCRVITEQYFGVRLRGSRWITTGISLYLAKLMLRVFHGRNDFVYSCRQDLQTLMHIEHTKACKPLVQLSEPFIPGDREELQWLELKSYLVIWILDNRLEGGILQRILSQIWEEYLNDRLDTGLSNVAFLKLCKKIAGRDMRSFADQWILSAGCPVFTCSFTFNRKRSSIDVDFKQSTPGFPQKKVAGSLLIRVHEVDGVYDHSVHIDDFSHHFELPVHAKAKKIKKKKKSDEEKGSSAGSKAITIVAPEEVPSSGATPQDSPGGSQVPSRGKTIKKDDTDEYISPLSWIRLDPEMEWLASLELRQPDYMLIEQLKHDKDVIAQFDAIQVLLRHPATDAIVEAFEKAMMDTKLFYHIRMDAIRALSTSAPSQETHLGGLKLISYYNRTFALQSSETVVVPVPKTNHFDNIQSYFVVTTLPGAMAIVKTRNNTLMELIGQILLNMLRYNDNAGNPYSDAYHVARIIDAMVVHIKGRKEIGLSIERLSRELIKELDRYAIVERVSPYYQNFVMQAIVRAWEGINSLGLTPSFAIVSPEMLIQNGNFLYIREKILKFALLSSDTLQLVESGLGLLKSNKLMDRHLCAQLLASLQVDTFLKWRERLDKTILWDLTWANRGNPHVLYLLFNAFGKLVEPSPLDSVKEVGSSAGTSTTPTTTTKVSLKLVIPKISDITSNREESAAVDIGEEPDWYYEVAGEEAIRSRPIAGSNSRLKLSSATPFASSAAGVLTSRLQQILHSLWNHFDSFPFRNPVDISVPGYYDVIKQPMDLSTLEKKLESNRIGSLLQFCSDLRLVFENCFQFNLPDSVIYEQAKRLRSHAIKELKKLFPEHSHEIKNMLMPSLVLNQSNPSKSKAEAKRSKSKKNAKKSVTPTERRPEIMNLQERMQLVFRKAKEHPYAFWFSAPVDPVALNIPTYLEIIEEPMDLGTLEQRLATEELSVNEFVRLLNLIFTNCTTFNPPNTIVHQNALQMHKAVTKLIKKYLLEAEQETDDSFKVTTRTQENEHSSILPIKINVDVPPEQIMNGTRASPAKRLKLKISVPSTNKSSNSSNVSWESKALQELLSPIYQHEHAEPFFEPVDPIALNIPTYSNIIKQPIDLSTIKKKLQDGYYDSPASMNRDFKLMFANCYKFNGKKAPISEATKVLEVYYNDLYKALFKDAK